MKTFALTLAAIALLSILTGCGTLVSTIKSDAELTQFTRADAARAKAIALADGDQAAAQCWASIVDHLPERIETDRQAIGALSAFQIARSARRLADAGMSEETRQKCAVLLLDAGVTSTSLISKILTAGPLR